MIRIIYLIENLSINIFDIKKYFSSLPRWPSQSSSDADSENKRFVYQKYLNITEANDPVVWNSGSDLLISGSRRSYGLCRTDFYSLHDLVYVGGAIFPRGATYFCRGVVRQLRTYTPF